MLYYTRDINTISLNQTYIPERKGEIDTTFADITMIEKVIGWKPEIKRIGLVKMKISIIARIMPIPPTGWGAVETLIWDMRIVLTVLGHEVDIVNVNDPRKIAIK